MKISGAVVGGWDGSTFVNEGRLYFLQNYFLTRRSRYHCNRRVGEPSEENVSTLGCLLYP